MKQKLKNAQMFQMLGGLQSILSHRNKIGYIAARNYRIISESLTEYETIRRDLIEKYGEETTDENGIPVVALKIESPSFKLFCDEMEPFNEMEHEVELMKAKYEDAIGCLSGEEILGIDWMLED